MSVIICSAIKMLIILWMICNYNLDMAWAFGSLLFFLLFLTVVLFKVSSLVTIKQLTTCEFHPTNKCCQWVLCQPAGGAAVTVFPAWLYMRSSDWCSWHYQLTATVSYCICWWSSFSYPCPHSSAPTCWTVAVSSQPPVYFSPNRQAE